jgi:uncharacterized protein YbjT (DUF2867 family)
MAAFPDPADVEYPLAGADAASLDDRRAEFGDEVGREGGVVPERPHRSVFRFQRPVGIRARENFRHGSSLRSGGIDVPLPGVSPECVAIAEGGNPV